MIYQDKIIEEYDIVFSGIEDNIHDASINSNDENTTANNGETVDILYPEDVRWFYKSIQSNKNSCLKAFNAYDSLRLETKFQELSVFKGANNVESDCEKIVVKKNLFEVDVRKRSCVPIYWTDEDDRYKVFRGTWFKSSSYVPLSESLADAIESQHMMNFGSLYHSWLKNLRMKKRKVLHSMDYGDSIIIWYGIDDVFIYLNKAATRIMNKWKILSPGTKICRGYKNKALFVNRPIEITHLCFVVHGIGQKLECKINRDCHKLKHNCKKILKTHFSSDQVGQFRIEFLPIEWRTGLNLDGGIIDSITPNEFKGLRTILNSTIMDILYYSSSLYRTEITQGLEFELNRLYSMFCARNPYFETKGGKVSILAHSLGSVICYDIIRSWMMPLPDSDYHILMTSLIRESEEMMEKIDTINAAKRSIQELEEEIRKYLASKTIASSINGFRTPNFPSNFREGSIWKRITEIDNFFTLGSPLPVFLALRGIKPHGNNTHNDILPLQVCKRIFNIFHPSDPVAYRLEPLIIQEYMKVKPVHIESLKPNVESSTTDSSSTMTQNETTDNSLNENISENVFKSTESEMLPNENDVGPVNFIRRHSNIISEQISETIKKLENRHRSIIPAVEEFQMKMRHLKSLPFFKRITTFINILKGEDVNIKDGEQASDNISSYEPMDDYRPLENRLDFTLGDERTILSFISLFTSHTSYWDDENLAKFVLDQVVADYSEYKNQIVDC